MLDGVVRENLLTCGWLSSFMLQLIWISEQIAFQAQKTGNTKALIMPDELFIVGVVRKKSDRTVASEGVIVSSER